MYFDIKKTKVLIAIAVCLLTTVFAARGQVIRSPKLTIMATGSMPASMARTTNFNPSVSLDDTTLAFVYDSLRADGCVTIFTVYETDADSAIGLWQIGSGTNRALWLNSQRASYDEFAITYRKSTEKGVVVHTMQYQYPTIDSSYNGHDTIYVGREGDTYGSKNFCALRYYPGQISRMYQRQRESALAIQYSAILHGSYINSLSDTLWDATGNDSLFSFGICGIGRDDVLSLNQARSMIRNDALTLEAGAPLSDHDHIMLGCDSNTIDFSDENIIIDTVSYLAAARHWKLRAHTNSDLFTVSLSVGLPIPAEAIRLMLISPDGSTLLTPDTGKSFTLTLMRDENYYISLLVDSSVLPDVAKGAKIDKTILDNVTVSALSNDLSLTVSPNPTSGKYTLSVNQTDDDLINIKVVDAHGRLIEQHTTSEALSQYIYNGNFEVGGVYYITVSSNGLEKTTKLIVVH